MTSERKEAVRVDMHPSFWNEYMPPATFVAAEVQKPAHAVDGYSLAVAYMRDWRNSRKPKNESR